MDNFGIEPLPSPFKVYSNIQTVIVYGIINTTLENPNNNFKGRIDIDFIPDIIKLKSVDIVGFPIDDAHSEGLFKIETNLIPTTNLVTIPIVYNKLYDTDENDILFQNTIINLKPNFSWLNKSKNRIQGEYLFNLSSVYPDPGAENIFKFLTIAEISLTFEFIKY
jgi:hypothetical protein